MIWTVALPELTNSNLRDALFSPRSVAIVGQSDDDAKAACNQAGFEAASEAVQIMGATGYSQESLVEWCMRRCRGWMIAGGSIEILKNRIAEHIFDRRFDQRRPKPAEAAE